MSTYVLPSHESHFIGKTVARTMINRYKDQLDTILASAYQGLNILCDSETFVLHDISLLLAQEGCAGLRIYYGMKEDLTVHAILVAVNAAGQDILASENELLEETDLILEEGKRCPPVCPETGGLGS